jgi:hypothetical protein
MRKLLALPSLVGLALAAGVGTPSLAQDPGYTFESGLEVTPRKAGTKSDPRGVRLDGRLNFRTVQGTEIPVITSGRVLLPRGIVYNGGSYPECRGATLRDEGLQSCPDRSTMGQGRSPSFADVVDGVKPRVVFVNGGARRIWAYTTLFSPAFLQEAVSIEVERLNGRRWSYALKFEVPGGLQVIAGVPGVMPRFVFAIGGKPYAPDYLATNAGCPKRGFRPYVINLDYRFHPDGPAGTSVYRGRLACR